MGMRALALAISARATGASRTCGRAVAGRGGRGMCGMMWDKVRNWSLPFKRAVRAVDERSPRCAKPHEFHRVTSG